MRFIIILFIGILFSFDAQGQNDVVPKTFFVDFGVFDRSESPDTVLTIYNYSKDTLLFDKVAHQLGGVSILHELDTMMPGDTNRLSFSIAPDTVLGSISEWVGVNFKNDSIVSNIVISYFGFRQRELKRPEKVFPHETSDWRMEDSHIYFGNLRKGEVKVFEVEWYNQSDNVLSFLPDETFIQPYWNLEILDEFVPVNGLGRLVFSLRSDNGRKLGFGEDHIEIFYKNEKGEVKSQSLWLVGNLLPNIDTASATYPTVRLDRTRIDFGSINAEDLLDVALNVSNTGTEILEIRGVESNCSCLKAELEKDSISVGGTAKLKLTLDLKNRKGKQYFTVSLFTNDPYRSVMVIYIRANVS